MQMESRVGKTTDLGDLWVLGGKEKESRMTPRVQLKSLVEMMSFVKVEIRKQRQGVREGSGHQVRLGHAECALEVCVDMGRGADLWLWSRMRREQELGMRELPGQANPGGHVTQGKHTGLLKTATTKEKRHGHGWNPGDSSI